MTAREMAVSEIARELAARAPELCAELLPGGRRDGAEWRAGDVSGTAGQSLGVHLLGAKAGVWSDFSSGESGDALDLVMAARALTKGEAVRWAIAWLGIEPTQRTKRPAAPAPTPDSPGDDARKTEVALAILRASTPIGGTLAETYLRARGVVEPESFADLAFHPALRHPSGHTGPALIATFRRLDNDAPQAIHRIWLTADGSGKAEIAAPKMMLGPVRGCAIKLVPDAEVTGGLGISEGIETALATMSCFGWRPIWAMGSAGSIAQFPVLPGVECLTIFSDNDMNQAGIKAARTCAERWRDAGRDVMILLPRGVGDDWADAATVGRAA